MRVGFILYNGSSPCKEHARGGMIQAKASVQSLLYRDAAVTSVESGQNEHMRTPCGFYVLTHTFCLTEWKVSKASRY